MSFFENLIEKYSIVLDKDISKKELEALVLSNPLQHDYITINNEVVNIYSRDVKFQQIFDFFGEKMPWVKFRIDNEIFSLKDPVEIINAKFSVFNQLAGLLSKLNEELYFFKEKGNPLELLNLESKTDYKKNGKTIH